MQGNHQGNWVVSEMRIYVEIDWRFKEGFPSHCVRVFSGLISDQTVVENLQRDQADVQEIPFCSVYL